MQKQTPLFYLKLILLAFTIPLLSACAQISLTQVPTKTHVMPTIPASSTQTKVKTQHPIKNSPSAATPVSKKSFDQDTLYELLTAEIAAQRGRYDITLENYADAAKRTHDIGIIKRAIRIAEFLKASNAQLQLAKLWINVEPQKIKAHQFAAFQYARHKNYANAVKEMEKVLEMGGQSDLDTLAIRTKLLPLDDQKKILKLYKKLAKRHPKNDQVLYSLAILQQYTHDYKTALQTLAPVLKRSPKNVNAIILQGRILYGLKKMKEARILFQNAIRQLPKNRKIKTFYATLLIDQKRLNEAQAVFKELMEQYPQTPGLKLSYALVATENHHPDIAKVQFEELLKKKLYLNDVQYYLAQINEREKNYQEAINHYYQVKTGIHFYPSISRASILMNKLGKLDDALRKIDEIRGKHPRQAETIWELEIDLLLKFKKQNLALTMLDKAIKVYPKNNKLVYTRAMLYEKTGQFKKMEKEMLRMIRQNPNNSMALNALGYTYADQNIHIKKAFQFIQKAHKLKPKNPAILDSMGWVQYRKGNLLQAKVFLQKAYKMLPIPEVAAHLGEVLWISNEKKNALKIWQEGLNKKPKNTYIQQAMKRLGAHFSNSPAQ